MKRLRILVLMHHHLVPPADAGPNNRTGASWMCEYDVLQALTALGHQVFPLGVKDELLPIRHAIEEHRPHVTFNLLTFFHGVGTYDAWVVSYLELLKAAYTGANPRSILLCGDKALTKKILTWHRIKVPRFSEVAWGRKARLPRRLSYPVIVKSRDEHASLGIAQASVVHDDAGLQERVDFVHRNLSTGAIVEEYIEGRELTVTVLGNERLNALPPWELTFGNLPEGSEPIQTYRVKWDLEYQKKLDVRTGAARDLDPDLAKKLAHTAKRIYRCLNLSGFARVDFRLAQDGIAYALEANPNPQLARGEDVADAAAATGMGYEELIQKIVNLGIAYRPAWKD